MEKVSASVKAWDLVVAARAAVDSVTEQKAESRRQKAEKALLLSRRTLR